MVFLENRSKRRAARSERKACTAPFPLLATLHSVLNEVESACKPGSVRLAARQSFLSARRRHLAPATYPGTTRAALSFPYLVLLRVGFTVPRGVSPARGALLPHPFTLTCALAGHRRFALCCTGRQLTPPRSYLALCPVEPGLSSTRTRRDATARPTPVSIVAGGIHWHVGWDDNPSMKRPKEAGIVIPAYVAACMAACAIPDRAACAMHR